MSRLLAALVTAVACAASWASPKGQGVAEPSPAPKGQATNNADRHQYPTEDAPFPVRVIEAPSDAAHSKEREAKTDEHDAKDLDAQVRTANAAEEQVRIGWSAFGLSFAGAILLGWTLFETRKSAKAAIASAEQAVRAANAAESSVKVSKDSFAKQLRAYVYLESVEMYYSCLHPKKDGKNRLKVTFKNYGATPAMTLGHGACLYVSANMGTDEPRSMDMARSARGALGKDSILEFDIEETLTNEEYEDVMKGRKSLYCICKVTYQDILDEVRETAAACVFDIDEHMFVYEHAFRLNRRT